MLVLLKNHLNYLNFNMIIFSNAFLRSTIKFYFLKKLIFVKIHNDEKSKA